MKILLTGSGGFIGKNLKKFLEDKHELFCPRSYELDLCNKSAVKEYFKQHEINFIIHCGSTGGARGIADRDTTVEDNLLMLNNLIEVKTDDARIITFGSGAMYGKDRDLHKVKEEQIGEYLPKDLYGISKLKMSEVVNTRDDILMLNIFACYGYGEKENRFPSYAINQVIKGEDITINQNVVFDYLWVEDMQRIVDYFIEHKPINKIINITPTQSVSLKEIAEVVKDFSDKKVEVIVKNLIMNYEYTGDNSVLLQEISGFRFTDVNIGLKNLFDYNKSILMNV